MGGQDLAGLAPKQRDVAMVFQSYALYPHLDVFGNLAFPLRMAHEPKAEIQRKVSEAAELLGIAKAAHQKAGPTQRGPAPAGGHRPGHRALAALVSV